MTKPRPTRFSVVPGNEAAAVAHLAALGYAPITVEDDGHGLRVLIFAAMADDALPGLVAAMPVHLSAKIGIVGGDGPPFRYDPYPKRNRGARR